MNAARTSRSALRIRARREKNICVLATIAGKKPYCSLMAYAANEDGTEIYMATHRSTQKFRNLSENSAVSLMIDTREEATRSQARALTVEGTCTRIEDEVKQQFVKTRLAAHEYPREVEFIQELPLTATRKIMRKDLRKMEVERKR